MSAVANMVCPACARMHGKPHAIGCPRGFIRPHGPLGGVAKEAHRLGWEAAQLHFTQAIVAEHEAQDARAVRLLRTLAGVLRAAGDEFAAELVEGTAAVVEDGGLPG